MDAHHDYGVVLEPASARAASSSSSLEATQPAETGPSIDPPALIPVSSPLSSPLSSLPSSPLSSPPFLSEWDDDSDDDKDEDDDDDKDDKESDTEKLPPSPAVAIRTNGRKTVARRARWKQPRRSSAAGGKRNKPGGDGVRKRSVNSLLTTAKSPLAKPGVDIRVGGQDRTGPHGVSKK